MKNKGEEMRLQLLNKQIIDEREEGLANKAGAETAALLFLVWDPFFHLWWGSVQSWL